MEIVMGPAPKRIPSKDYGHDSIKNTGIIPCACMSPEHCIIYTKDPDDDEVWLRIALERKAWYKRIWIGIKYIFGYRSKYGMFGEMLISRSNVDRLEDIVKHINK